MNSLFFHSLSLVTAFVLFGQLTCSVLGQSTPVTAAQPAAAAADEGVVVGRNERAVAAADAGGEGAAGQPEQQGEEQQKAARLSKLTQLTFDRRPAAILTEWLKLEAEKNDSVEREARVIPSRIGR